jgi:hypothetical protein
VRTVQRHLHLLKDQGVIKFVERRRNKGPPAADRGYKRLLPTCVVGEFSELRPD